MGAWEFEVCRGKGVGWGNSALKQLSFEASATVKHFSAALVELVKKKTQENQDTDGKVVVNIWWGTSGLRCGNIYNAAASNNFTTLKRNDIDC